MGTQFIFFFLEFPLIFPLAVFHNLWIMQNWWYDETFLGYASQRNLLGIFPFSLLALELLLFESLSNSVGVVPGNPFEQLVQENDW